MVSMSWWALWELWSQFSPTAETALTRLRTEYFGVCFIPTLFYHGVMSLLEVRRRREITVAYLLGLLFAVLIAIL